MAIDYTAQIQSFFADHTQSISTLGTLFRNCLDRAIHEQKAENLALLISRCLDSRAYKAVPKFFLNFFEGSVKYNGKDRTVAVKYRTAHLLYFQAKTEGLFDAQFFEFAKAPKSATKSAHQFDNEALAKALLALQKRAKRAGLEVPFVTMAHNVAPMK